MFGRNWKGTTGGIGMMLAGVWDVFKHFQDGSGDLGRGLGTVAAGLGLVGIRGAQGKR